MARISTADRSFLIPDEVEAFRESLPPEAQSAKSPPGLLLKPFRFVAPPLIEK